MDLGIRNFNEQPQEETDTRVPTDVRRAELGELVKALNDHIGVVYAEGRAIGLNLAYQGRAGMEKSDQRPFVGIAVGDSRRA